MRPSAATSGEVFYDPASARLYGELAAPHFQPVADCLAEEAGAETASAILEIAAGSGCLTQALALRLGPNAQLLATDRSEAMLGAAREALSTAGEQINFAVLDYETPFELEDDSFDLIVSQFGYLQTTQRGLEECARVLRPGGHLCLAFWADDYLELKALSGARKANGLSPIRPYPVQELEENLKHCGLAPTSIVGIGFPAHFENRDEYTQYRKSLGLPNDPKLEEQDLEVVATAAEMIESEQGPGEPLSFEWWATLVGAAQLS